MAAHLGTCRIQNTPASERVYDKHRGFHSPGNPIQPLASPSARFMAAHQGSGRDVPDLHEGVLRPADDALAVPRESDRAHGVRVTRQRAHLPPTRLHLRGWSWRIAGVSARPLEPGRPVIMLSGLAEVLFGFLKPDCRDHHVQIENS